MPEWLTAETAFRIANFSVLPFWALLILLPRWQGTQILVHSIAMPVLLGAAYVWLVATGAFFGPNVPADAGFTSLAGVMKFFTIPEAVVAGWIHYLVFDLFVGAWISRDAQRREIPHLAVIPAIALTFLFGPVGLMLYALMRLTWKNVASLNED